MYDVNTLIKQFDQMNKMMGKMRAGLQQTGGKKGKKRGLGGLGGLGSLGNLGNMAEMQRMMKDLMK